MFAVATVYCQANQAVRPVPDLDGNGLAGAIGRAYSGLPARATFERIVVPYLSDIPIVGRAFFSQNILVYLIYLILPFVLHYLMFKTRHGLNMRAVGENPAAADAAGIAVHVIRFWYVAAGAALGAGAGAYLTLAFVPGWSDGVIAGRGWIAVALVIFAGYRPWIAVFAALLFGVITSIGFVGQRAITGGTRAAVDLFYLARSPPSSCRTLSRKNCRCMAVPAASSFLLPRHALRDRGIWKVEVACRPCRSRTSSSSPPSTMRAARSRTAPCCCATM